MDEYTSHELAYQNGFSEGHEKGYKEGFLRGFDAGKQDAQKWIPVTERLPEVDTPVLTYRETGQNVELLWQRGCQKRWDYDEFTPYPVTHWMPLPEAPKGE